MLVTLSCPTLCAPWTTWLYVAYQSLLSMEFSRQEYWSGKRFLSLGDLPNPGIEPGSLALQADSLPSELPGKTCVLLKLSKGLRTLGCRFIFSGFLPWKWKSLSHVRLCDPMDYSLPVSFSMGFSRQEYWSGLPFPSPGDLLNPGIKAVSPALQADSLPTVKAHITVNSSVW